MLTGLIIASYTVIDGYSVKVLALSPVLVDYAGNLFRTPAFSPPGVAGTNRDSRGI
jgi:hypothetical protein